MHCGDLASGVHPRPNVNFARLQARAVVAVGAGGRRRGCLRHALLRELGVRLGHLLAHDRVGRVVAHGATLDVLGQVPAGMEWNEDANGDHNHECIEYVKVDLGGGQIADPAVGHLDNAVDASDEHKERADANHAVEDLHLGIRPLVLGNTGFGPLAQTAQVVVEVEEQEWRCHGHLDRDTGDHDRFSQIDGILGLRLSRQRTPNSLDDERAEVACAEAEDVPLARDARPLGSVDVHDVLEGDVVDRADEGWAEDEADDLGDVAVAVKGVVVSVGTRDPACQLARSADDCDEHEAREEAVVGEESTVDDQFDAKEAAEEDACPECWLEAI
ncbi:hypothetical protein L1887_58893 [Cichorium endivia]|nr:hypothetical protein L1887_58893 [Cichorium endivia]